MRRTKILATLGPASCSAQMVTKLLEAGVDAFRLNFSHGSHDEHKENFEIVRAASHDLNIEIPIIQDLCGPKMRVGKIENDHAELIDGSTVTITTNDEPGTAERFSTSYASLPDDVVEGNRILLNDGLIELQVISTSGTDTLCNVLQGGILQSRKGMNLPGTLISTPSVTAKDMADLQFGLKLGVDFVALSFVRQPGDIEIVKAAIRQHGSDAQVIAKIEKPEAVENIDEIIACADGILVARGDLGVELDLARVPLIQKTIVRKANEQDKYVIVATQMLESMIVNKIPTRAEVADVSNAIIDGTDVVMLSGETAVGANPVETVTMMDRIACRTEEYLEAERPQWNWSRINDVNPIQDAIGRAAFRLCEDLPVAAIAAFSASGGTALYISKSRPFAPIIAFTTSSEALRRMRLFWGVTPVRDDTVHSKDDLLTKARNFLKEKRIGKPGDNILLIAGTKFGQVGSTDAIELAQL